MTPSRTTLAADKIPIASPPDGAFPSPPVETCAMSLPFGELSWENFERLCYRLAAQSAHVEHTARYGRTGQAQQGIDIFARKTNGRYEVWQAKRYQKFNAAQVKKAVKAFVEGTWLAKSDKLVIAVQANLDDVKVQEEIESQTKELAERDVALVVLGGDRLTAQVRPHQDLVANFFGKGWLKAFYGDAVDSSIASRLDGEESARVRAQIAPRVETSGPPTLRFRTDIEIDDASVSALLHSLEPLRIDYHDSLRTMIEIMEARDADFMPFMEQNPYFMAELDFGKRERWAAGDHAQLAADLWLLKTRMVATEEGLGRLIQRLRSKDTSPDLASGALRTFGKFAVLRLVAVLKKQYNLQNGRPEPWFLHWKLNEKANMSPIDLVPMTSDTGRRIFGFNRFVIARVGVSEERYDYVVLPFDIAVDLHQSGKSEPAIYYNWLLPQLSYHSLYFDDFTPSNWEVYVLLGNDGREWYYPSQINPWL